MKKLTHFPGKLKPEQIASIVRIEGAGSYSILHFVDSKPLVMSYPVKVFESLLPGFIRIHKQNLANPIHVKSINFAEGRREWITFFDGTEKPIARRRVEEMYRVLNHGEFDRRRAEKETENA